MTYILDYSTINFPRLRQLPTLDDWTRKNRWQSRLEIDSHMGSSCFLDAPGYPTYFLQHIYNSGGNDPNGQSIRVIRDPETGKLHIIDLDYTSQGNMHDLWVAPLYTSERVLAWMSYSYSYFFHCYADPRKGEQWRNASNCISWPVPQHEVVSVAYFRDRESYSDEYRAQMLAEVEEKRQVYIEERRALAIPEHHLAVLHIQDFYPQHSPILEWIEENSHGYGQGKDWWERCSHE